MSDQHATQDRAAALREQLYKELEHAKAEADEQPILKSDYYDGYVVGLAYAIGAIDGRSLREVLDA